MTNQRPRLSRAISTLSFGVARDIIRRCDELIAREDRDLVVAADLADALKRMHIRMGYELHQLTKSQVTRLVNVRSDMAALAARTIISDDKLASDSDERLVLLVWLISLIEVASEISDQEAWLQLTDEQCAIGYRLSIDSVDDLRSEIEDLHIRVLRFVQESTGRPTPQIAA